jgi:hypothetical protein
MRIYTYYTATRGKKKRRDDRELLKRKKLFCIVYILSFLSPPAAGEHSSRSPTPLDTSFFSLSIPQQQQQQQHAG